MLGDERASTAVPFTLTFMSLTALLWRLLIISSNQRPLCSIHTMISPCSSHVVSFEYVAFQVTHT